MRLGTRDALLRRVTGDAVAGFIDTVATSTTLNEGFRALGRAGTLVALGHVPDQNCASTPSAYSWRN